MNETTDSKRSSADFLFFNIDGIKSAVLALKVLDDQLAKVLEEPLYWKWAVLALHDALQGFMVANLAYTSDLNVMREARECPHCHREVSTAICPGCGEEIFNKRSWGTRSEWHMFHYGPASLPRQEREPPKPPRLIDFMEMYGRIKKDDYMANQISGAKTFRRTKKQNKSVESLHLYLRNKFVHFTPEFLSDYTPGLLSEVMEILPIISFLAFDSRIIDWSYRAELENDTRDLLENLKVRVASLEKTYNDEINRWQPS
jgi:hypothetical protein